MIRISSSDFEIFFFVTKSQSGVFRKYRQQLLRPPHENLSINYGPIDRRRWRTMTIRFQCPRYNQPMGIYLCVELLKDLRTTQECAVYHKAYNQCLPLSANQPVFLSTSFLTRHFSWACDNIPQCDPASHQTSGLINLLR